MFSCYHRINIARPEKSRPTKKLRCKPLSAQVWLQPGSICLDMFVNGLAVTWLVTVVSQGSMPVYRTDT